MNKLIKKVLVGITAATMMFGSVCTAFRPPGALLGGCRRWWR